MEQQDLFFFYGSQMYSHFFVLFTQKVTKRNLPCNDKNFSHTVTVIIEDFIHPFQSRKKFLGKNMDPHSSLTSPIWPFESAP